MKREFITDICNDNYLNCTDSKYMIAIV